jgi:hypothetical protein
MEDWITSPEIIQMMVESNAIRAGDWIRLKLGPHSTTLGIPTDEYHNTEHQLAEVTPKTNSFWLTDPHFVVGKEQIGAWRSGNGQ